MRFPLPSGVGSQHETDCRNRPRPLRRDAGDRRAPSPRRRRARWSRLDLSWSGNSFPLISITPGIPQRRSSTPPSPRVKSWPRRSTARWSAGASSGRVADLSSCASCSPMPTGPTPRSGRAAPAVPAGSGVQTFPSSVPIKAGQLIGVDNTNTSDELGIKILPGGNYAFSLPALAEGVATAMKPNPSPTPRVSGCQCPDPARPGRHRGEREIRLDQGRDESHDHRHRSRPNHRGQLRHPARQELRDRIRDPDQRRRTRIEEGHRGAASR